MAPYRSAILFLAYLVGQCGSVHGRSSRFGAPASTLHMPRLLEAEKWGEKFVVLRAEGLVDKVDSVGKLLREPLHRIRRQAPSNRGTVAPPPPKPEKTEAHLNDSHTMLVVHWAGEGSDMIIALAKSSSQSQRFGLTQPSNIYVSRDYGKSFQDISSKFRSQWFQVNSVSIDKYYNSELLNSHYVFADVTNKCLFTTRDYIQTVTRHCDLPFQPKVVSLNPTNPEHILAFDPDSWNSDLYLSKDFGQSFEVIRSNVKSFFWGVQPYDDVNTLYVEEKRGMGGNTVLRTSSYFENGQFNTSIEGVEDFEVQEEYLFATKNVHLIGSQFSSTLQFWVSYKRGPFLAAQFPHFNNHTDFYVADASEDQVMLCVTHNGTDTHLYISDVQGTRFSLSLENIVFFNPKKSGKDTWLSYYTNESFADIHKVGGLRGIYIASQLTESSLTPEHQRSLITYDKGGEWELLNPPRDLHSLSNINCTLNPNCSLHVTQEFMQLYPNSQAQPLMSRDSAPGLILASGTVGPSLRSHLDMFVSADAGNSWYQVLEGNYIYAMADHGGVLLAAKQFQPTDTIYYSLDEGHRWTAFNFTSEPIRIYGLLTEPGERTTVFSIFGSRTQLHSWVLVQLNMSTVLGSSCSDNDYKDWSLPDSIPDKGCLLGRKLVYSRRIPHAVCYNGRDFVRPKRIENCTCTRDDFECDFGWRTSNVTNMCVVDADVFDTERNAVPSPCPPGTYYMFSRGYRLVAGDTCGGGQEHVYAPLQYSCPIQERRESLLVASHDSIRSYDLGGSMSSSAQTLVWEYEKQITAVAFDYAQNRIFWATSPPATIFARHLSGESETVVLAEGHMQEVTSLAYDWTGQNLYWTDGGNTQGTIEVVNASGMYRRSLIVSNRNVTQPTGLVLDPLHGWMYWIEKTRFAVMRSSMDGNVSTIYTLYVAYARITGLTLDLAMERLYWTLHDGSIHSIKTDGTNWMRMNLSSYLVGSPGAVFIYKGDLFWYNEDNRALMMSPTLYPGIAMRQTTFPVSVVDMEVVDHVSQSATSACTPMHQQCTQLCVPRPHYASPGMLNRTCLCGELYQHEKQTSGDERCLCGHGETINSTQGCVVSGSNATCEASKFRCASGRCLPLGWRCDHEDDCGDNSDELDCPFYQCPSDMFKCSNGRCVSGRWHCDFDNDCGDGSDEASCVYPTCSPGLFHCNNGRCIPSNWMCDFDDDCHDRSDEANCTYNHHVAMCESYQFLCGSGECVPSSNRCDGMADCVDTSDERNCSVSLCLFGQFACATHTNNVTQCIFTSWRCDGARDCSDGSDEANCTGITTPMPHPSTTPQYCGYNMFRCDSGYCIYHTQVCDSINDCGDYSDERYCSYTTSTLPPYTSCRSSQFTCNSGQCIPSEQHCDGHNDCYDNSDELDCNDTTCMPSEFMCYKNLGLQGSRCIWGAWRCDGDADCQNGEDELYCSTICSSSEFRCVRSYGCVPLSLRCNHQRDCEDGSDEFGCHFATCSQQVDVDSCCAERSCVYLDCPQDKVKGCFQNNTTSFGHSCSLTNNNKCTSPPVTSPPDQPKDSQKYFHCRSDQKSILWMYVCNGMPNCDDRSDEESCTSDLMCSQQLTIGYRTNVTATISWSPYFCSMTIVSFTVSYYRVGHEDEITNRTTNNTTLILTNLIPAKQYVVTVYPVSSDKKVFYPALPQVFFTTPGVPSQVSNVKVKVVGDSFLLSWSPPQQPNCALTTDLQYFVYLQPVGKKLEKIGDAIIRQVSRTSLVLDFMDHDIFNISIIVSNGDYFSSPSDNLTLTRFQPITISVVPKTITANSVKLQWSPQNNANLYVVTALLPYQEERAIELNTTDTSLTVGDMCPGEEVFFGVRTLFKDGGESAQSDYVNVTFPGGSVPAVTDLMVSLSNDKAKNSSVLVTFTRPKSDAKSACTVYYMPGADPDLNQFMLKAARYTMPGVENTTVISGLYACERYYFRVGCGLPTCRISPTATVSTPEDMQAPPKNLRYQLMYSSGRISVQLTWTAPCDTMSIPLDYEIETTLPDGNVSRDRFGNVTKNTQLSFLRQNTGRGATYVFRVRTNTSGSAFTAPLTVEIPRYPMPEGLQLWQTNSTIVMRWQKPVDSPPDDIFVGYNVTLRGDDGTVTSEVTLNTNLIKHILPGHDYDVSVTVVVKDGPQGEPATSQMYANALDDDNNGPNTKGAITLTKTHLVAIVVPVCVVVVALVVVVMVFVVRHRRLQRSFLAFANSHYNTRSGTTTFSGDLDGDDEPLIQGFSDDEPLVLA